MDRVWKLLKRAQTHENFLKIQLELVNLRKTASFTWKWESDIQDSDAKLA